MLWADFVEESKTHASNNTTCWAKPGSAELVKVWPTVHFSNDFQSAHTASQWNIQILSAIDGGFSRFLPVCASAASAPACLGRCNNWRRWLLGLTRRRHAGRYSVPAPRPSKALVWHQKHGGECRWTEDINIPRWSSLRRQSLFDGKNKNVSNIFIQE